MWAAHSKPGNEKETIVFMTTSKTPAFEGLPIRCLRYWCLPGVRVSPCWDMKCGDLCRRSSCQ